MYQGYKSSQNIAECNNNNNNKYICNINITNKVY